MINICVINPNYYRSSGVTVAIKRLYYGSSEMPIKWHFIDCSYNKKLEQVQNDETFLGNKKYFHLMTGNVIAFAIEFIKTIKYLRKEKIDLVHVHHRRLAVIFSWVCKYLNIGFVYTGQVTYKNEFWFRLTPKMICSAVSESVKENIIMTTRCQRVEVISNPTEFPKECPELKLENKLKAVCIARLDPVKNHAFLLKAWAQSGLQEMGATLDLIGEGSERDKLQSTCKELNIEKSIRFLGFQDKVTSILCNYSFAVLPSLVEGKPIVIIEAAACGIPTLATNVDGSRDCVPKNIKLPNLINVSHVDAMATALRIWVSNWEDLQHDGRMFFDYNKANSETEIVCQKYFSLYKEILTS